MLEDDPLEEPKYLNGTWEVYEGKYGIRKPAEKTKVETKKENKEMDKQLYQVKGKEIFGYIIGTNSAGKRVFEVKGSGEVKMYDPKDIEEVIPYTVGCKYLSTNSQVYNFFAKEGEFKVGDMIIDNSGDTIKVLIVVKLNTRSKQGTKWLEGFKVISTEIISGQ